MCDGYEDCEQGEDENEAVCSAGQIAVFDSLVIGHRSSVTRPSVGFLITIVRELTILSKNYRSQLCNLTGG